MESTITQASTMSMMTPMLWAAYSLALGRQAVQDSLDGNVEVYVGGASLVDQTLFCRRCGEMTTARMRLDAWIEFDKAFKQSKFTCSCGGVLIDHKPLILTP